MLITFAEACEGTNTVRPREGCVLPPSCYPRGCFFRHTAIRKSRVEGGRGQGRSLEGFGGEVKASVHGRGFGVTGCDWGVLVMKLMTRMLTEMNCAKT